MLSVTSSETELRRELNAKLLAVLETKKRWFPRMVALLGNEIRLCELGTDERGWPRVRYTYKIFGPDEVERAIGWIEALESH